MFRDSEKAGQVKKNQPLGFMERIRKSVFLWVAWKAKAEIWTESKGCRFEDLPKHFTLFANLGTM